MNTLQKYVAMTFGILVIVFISYGQIGIGLKMILQYRDSYSRSSVLSLEEE